MINSGSRRINIKLRVLIDEGVGKSSEIRETISPREIIILCILIILSVILDFRHVR